MRSVFISLFLYSLIVTTAQADGSRIIRPDPADYSHISDFRAEWCANGLCYGKALFAKVTRIRAILVKGGTEGALFVEDQWPRVELLKPRFGLVGPVNIPGSRSELGKAAVTIDQNGEVDSVSFTAPSFGNLQVQRPR